MKHHPDAIADNPVGVEALLHHRPRITLDDDRQSHHERLADTARPGFADKVIGKIHEVRNLAREALYVMRERKLERQQLLAQMLIVPANKNELSLESGRRNP